MRRHVQIGLVVLLAGTSGPVLAEWSFLGLGSQQVTTLELHGEVLYAGTRAGVYARRLDAADTLWTSLGLQDRQLRTLLVLDSQTLLAGTFVVYPDTVSLLRTTDGGATWSPYQNGFEPRVPEVRALEALPGSVTDLLGAGYGVEKSVDGGGSWRRVVDDDLINFVQANPRAPAYVWAGGENAIFSPVMHRSLDGGETWQRFQLEAGGDNACDVIAFHPTDRDVVYLGMEGRVMRTTDGGSTWEAVTSPNPELYLVGMAIPARMPLRVYAAGNGIYAPPGVVLYASDDSGMSWAAIVHPAAVRYGTWALLLVTDGATDTLFFGTDRGVYRYREIVSGVAGGSWTAVKKAFR